MSAQVTLITSWTVVVAAGQASAPWNTLGLVPITVVAVAYVGVCAPHGVHIALSVILVALRALRTAALMSTATGRVSAWAVLTARPQVSTTSDTLPIVTVSTAIRGVRGGYVAHSVIVTTLRVSRTAVLRVGASPVKITETFGTFGTLRVFTALSIIGAAYRALNIPWPVTHRTIRIFVGGVKAESPLAITLLVGCSPTVGTLKKTSFSGWATLPKPTAVCRVNVVHRLLSGRVNVVQAVWYHATVIG